MPTQELPVYIVSVNNTTKVAKKKKTKKKTCCSPHWGLNTITENLDLFPLTQEQNVQAQYNLVYAANADSESFHAERKE